jgi:hypothetical protein
MNISMYLKFNIKISYEKVMRQCDKRGLMFTVFGWDSDNPPPNRTGAPSNLNENDLDLFAKELFGRCVEFCELPADSPGVGFIFQEVLIDLPGRILDSWWVLAPPDVPSDCAPLMMTLVDMWRRVCGDSAVSLRFVIFVSTLRSAIDKRGQDWEKALRPMLSVLDQLMEIIGFKM